PFSQDTQPADARLHLRHSCLERRDHGAAAERLRAVRGPTHSAGAAAQRDDALELIQGDHAALSQKTRRFVAASLEFAVKAEQDRRNAQWASSMWPYGGYDNWFYWDLTR